jgi:poly(beta-D-mannuronate) lyase
MRKIILLFLLASFFERAAAKIYLVHSEAEFNTISASLVPGDIVRIAKGNYPPWALVINSRGEAGNPVIVEAETPNGVVFSGDVDHVIFTLTGSHTILRGINFDACNVIKAEGHTGMLVELEGSSYCRVTACNFTRNTARAQFMPIVVVSGNGKYNEVDHCNFTGNIDNQELQVKITKEFCPLYTMIDKNVFRDKIKVAWKVFNGGECVQVGQDPVLLGTVQSWTTVRENSFTRCNGEPEVISNKSSNNFYIKNKFEDCDGELVMRGGFDCVIDSNTIDGGNCGIRINGTGHRVTNNDIRNVKTAIRLMYGMAAGKTEIGFYIAAGDCVIKHNRVENATTGILIGDSKNADWTGKFDTKRYPSPVMQNVTPSNNQVEENIFINTTTNVVNQ